MHVQVFCELVLCSLDLLRNHRGCLLPYQGRSCCHLAHVGQALTCGILGGFHDVPAVVAALGCSLRSLDMLPGSCTALCIGALVFLPFLWAGLAYLWISRLTCPFPGADPGAFFGSPGWFVVHDCV